MSRVGYSDHPLSRPRPITVNLGLLFAVSVPLVGSIATARIDRLSIGGLNYTGYLWLGSFFLGCGLIAAKCLIPGRVTAFPVLLWMPWVCVMWLSVAWTEGRGTDQVQAALQLSMPVLVGAVAGALVRTEQELKQIVQAYFWALPVLSATAAVWLAFGLSDDLASVYVEARGLSLMAAVIGGLGLAGTNRSKRGYLIWAASLGIAAVTGSRMATLALLAQPVINPVKPGLARRLFVGGVVAVMGVALLMTPVFQERFFGEEDRDVSDIASGDFDDAGRFNVWPLVLEESLERPWLGHGVGTIKRWMPSIWARIEHPHNDYLRLGYEIGIVGLSLFLLAFLAQFILVWRRVARTVGVVQQAFAGAWLGMASFLIAACTDNPIGYTLLFMNPLFALVGAAYAVSSSLERRSNHG